MCPGQLHGGQPVTVPLGSYGPKATLDYVARAASSQQYPGTNYPWFMKLRLHVARFWQPVPLR
jgi:hypothetical protein